MRFADQLDSDDVALLMAALDQIEAAPGSFDIRIPFETCGSVMCIGGHMAVMNKAEILHSRYPKLFVHDFMINLCQKNRAWVNLLYTHLRWPQGCDDYVNALSVRARVEYWLETGE